MSPHKTSADGNKSESQKSDDTLTFAIGDIHGRYQALKALVENCKSYAGGRDMRFVFLGDYVDRGSETPAVLEFLIDFSQRMAGRIICLRGNHEACLLAAAMGDFKRVGFDATMEDWLGAGGGGSATLISYGVDHASDVPIRHLEWLRSLPLTFQHSLRFFVHAGVNPSSPLTEQREQDLLSRALSFG